MGATRPRVAVIYLIEGERRIYIDEERRCTLTKSEWRELSREVLFLHGLMPHGWLRRWIAGLVLPNMRKWFRDADPT